MKRLLMSLALLSVVLVGCSGDDAATVATTGAVASPTSTSTPTTVAPETDKVTPSSVVTDAPPVVANIGPVEPTPAQQEGPYYPVDKLTDRDNDLTVVAGSNDAADGAVLLLDGLLVTTDGDPIEGAVVEIWQTDDEGVYLHPNDPKTELRDREFQFYGEAVTAVDGSWSFRTIMPGEYEPRPRHIHTKVVIDGEVVLTSQIYFSTDDSGEDRRLIADVATATDDAGEPILTATYVIALSA